MKTMWLNAEGTTVLLMALKEENVIPEWHPVGQVTKRQVYEKLPPRWYAWKLSPPGSGDPELLGNFDRMQQATDAVEEANRPSIARI